MSLMRPGEMKELLLLSDDASDAAGSQLHR